METPEILIILLVLAGIAVSIACFVFWIWMLAHAAGNKGLTESERIGWILVVALVHFLGALVYFFAARPKGKVPLSPSTTRS
jgi:cytosine/uracil/thiamine/allantoin permease